MDSSGDLFGATINGGAFGLGVVYEVAVGSNTITPLASFNGTNGSAIWGGLALDPADNLFGTSSGGGSSGDGTIFEIAQGSNTITTLANFNGSDGANPFAGLTEDASGDFFGVAAAGGSSGDGTVFELANGSSTITTLASFNGTGNGLNPQGALVEDSSGNLFGTADGGGAFGDGTLFELVAGGGAVSAGQLTVNSSTGATLNNSNAVGTFHATNTASGAISFTNTATTLTLSGITETGGTVTVTNTGNIVVTGAISAPVGQNVGLTATGALSESGSGSVRTTGAGMISLVAGSTGIGASGSPFVVSGNNLDSTTSGNGNQFLGTTGSSHHRRHPP